MLATVCGAGGFVVCAALPAGSEDASSAGAPRLTAALPGFSKVSGAPRPPAAETQPRLRAAGAFGRVPEGRVCGEAVSCSLLPADTTGASRPSGVFLRRSVL